MSYIFVENGRSKTLKIRFIRFLRAAFFMIVIKPLVFFLLGVNIYHRNRLPKIGPAIIVANHNSHLDTAILMSLFSISQLQYLRPVAAADYFLRNRFISWFSRHIAGILPIGRKRIPGIDPFQQVHEALCNDAIVIFYPEGTRGAPGALSKLKSGIAHLAAAHPTVPVVPVFIHGSEKALPKGEALLVPFAVDIAVSEALFGHADKEKFIHQLEEIFTIYSQEFKRKSNLN